MMISEEQARAASRYVLPPLGEGRATRPVVSSDLMERVLRAVESAPETRPEHIERARQLMDAGGPEPSAIAESIIMRVIVDALR